MLITTSTSPGPLALIEATFWLLRGRPLKDDARMEEEWERPLLVFGHGLDQKQQRLIQCDPYELGRRWLRLCSTPRRAAFHNCAKKVFDAILSGKCRAWGILCTGAGADLDKHGQLDLNFLRQKCFLVQPQNRISIQIDWAAPDQFGMGLGNDAAGYRDVRVDRSDFFVSMSLGGTAEQPIGAVEQGTAACGSFIDATASPTVHSDRCLGPCRERPLGPFRSYRELLNWLVFGELGQREMTELLLASGKAPIVDPDTAEEAIKDWLGSGKLRARGRRRAWDGTFAGGVTNGQPWSTPRLETHPVSQIILGTEWHGLAIKPDENAALSLDSPIQGSQRAGYVDLEFLGDGAIALAAELDAVQEKRRLPQERAEHELWKENERNEFTWDCYAILMEFQFRCAWANEPGALQRLDREIRRAAFNRELHPRGARSRGGEREEIPCAFWSDPDIQVLWPDGSAGRKGLHPASTPGMTSCGPRKRSSA